VTFEMLRAKFPSINFDKENVPLLLRLMNVSCIDYEVAVSSMHISTHFQKGG